MIQLITDMMSDPRIQSSIIKMLEKHLKDMNVKKATHLVLMAMSVLPWRQLCYESIAPVVEKQAELRPLFYCHYVDGAA